MGYSKTSEKRRFLRYEVLDYAAVHLDGFPVVNAVIVDIGLGGIQIRSRENLPVGAHLKIHIGRMDSDPLILAGEVRHSAAVENSDLFLSGVRFQPGSHSERLAIAEYVHAVFQRQCDKLLL